MGSGWEGMAELLARAEMGAIRPGWGVKNKECQLGFDWALILGHVLCTVHELG